MTEFRTASQSELRRMLDWAANEGWNPGHDDAAAFFAADPEGFFVAVEDGAPVASISVVNHTDDFAFLGLYIALPAYRGKGIGHGLWQHALQHAGGRTVGLDGVPEQQRNYAVSGFRAAGSTTRFTGRVSPAAVGSIQLAQATDVPGLIELEAEASGVHKGAYLTAWFANTPNRKTLVDEHGHCTVRRCRNGAKIGPLVTSNEQASLRLVRQASAIMGPDVTIDVPERSKTLALQCRRLGMTAGFETIRMYRGDPPPTKEVNFAVTTLELG